MSFQIDRLELHSGQVEIEGRWYGVRGLRFVRPALVLTTREGTERRLLAELDDKPWAAEEGEGWRAAFALEAGGALKRADRVELSVAPDINVALRSGGVDAEGPIVATTRVSAPPSARVSEPPRPPATPTEPGAPAPESGEESDPPPPAPESESDSEDSAPPAPALDPAGEGTAPPTLSISAPEASPAPRLRPAVTRAPDVERLGARLRAAELELEREHELREAAERTLDSERTDARHAAAELARVRAELELARTAEREAADTAAQLDVARRDHHELRARHDALRADHDRLLKTHAELEEQLEARSQELKAVREELAEERRLRPAAGAGAGGQRTATLHVSHYTPAPRTDRPLNPSLRHRPWLRLLVLIVIAAVLFAVYLVLHSTVHLV